jgi:hypothetical protein
MPDIALSNAEALKKQLVNKRLALHVEIDALDTEIGKIDEFIRTWHTFAAGNTDFSVDNSRGSSKSESILDVPRTPRAKGNSSKEAVAAAAIEAIKERGAPIMRDELYDILTSRGLLINGKDPQMVLSTMLWRMKGEIERLGNGGYWLKGTPVPLIGKVVFDAAPTSNDIKEPSVLI